MLPAAVQEIMAVIPRLSSLPTTSTCRTQQASKDLAMQLQASYKLSWFQGQRCV